jgi:hypothetical protein
MPPFTTATTATPPSSSVITTTTYSASIVYQDVAVVYELFDNDDSFALTNVSTYRPVNKRRSSQNLPGDHFFRRLLIVRR